MEPFSRLAERAHRKAEFSSGQVPSRVKRSRQLNGGKVCVSHDGHTGHNVVQEMSVSSAAFCSRPPPQLRLLTFIVSSTDEERKRFGGSTFLIRAE